MKFRKTIGACVKYLPLVCLLCLHGVSLYFDVTNILNDTEPAPRIWKDVLLIIATLGLCGSLCVIGMLSKLTTGRPLNFIDELLEQDSKELAVSYNGFIGSSLFVTIFVILLTFYAITNNHLFMIVCVILGVALPLSVIANILAVYLQGKQKASKTFLSNILDPIILPVIINLFMMLITNKNTVGFVYENLQKPQNTIFQIIALIAILIYVPAIAFCHFSNLYCMIAFIFAKKDPEQIQISLDDLQRRDENRKNALRQITEYIDKRAEEVCFFKKFGLAICYFCSHIKAYCQGNIYVVSYLILLGELKTVQMLSELLKTDRIRTNVIRFCEITVVSELLVLNMLLFIFLGSDDPCSRFFELLSTVIIIPILLTSLGNLKVKK